MTEWGAQPILGSYAAVAALAGGLALLLLIAPQYARLAYPRRAALLGLRLVVILLVLLMLLRPTSIATERTPRSSVLVLLVDLSRSMELPSGQAKLSRWQAQRDLLAKARQTFAELGRKLELRTYVYDRSLRPITLDDGAWPLPETPTGDQTDIGTSLYDALQAELGKRLAGVIILGDGAQTAFEPRVEVQEAGRRVRDDFAAPLYAVVFGPAGDAAEARDVAVERFDEQFTVFVKNELVVRGSVRLRGYVQKDVPIELRLDDGKNPSQVIGRKLLRADTDGQQMEVEFAYTPQTPGRYRLQLAAEQQPGELVAKNNELTAYLTVLEGGLRILYLEGEKRFEHKFLRRAINSSPDIELDDRVIDRRSRASWPVQLGEDLRAGRYDAFILGDLDASALGGEQQGLIAQQVAKGKGLIALGGRSSFGWGHYRGTPLEPLLPISFDPIEGAPGLREDQLDGFFLDGPLTAKPAVAHPLTHLAPEAQNAAIWGKLPPFAWANKFRDVKASPATRVLLESPRGEPLLVSGEFGDGRVLAFAAESTYRWPMHGFDKEHKRFWRQVILWLVRRDDFSRDDVWIKLEQRRFNPGARVAITAGARSSAGDAIPSTQLETHLILPDGSKQPLTLKSDKDQFSGSVLVQAPGQYAVETRAESQGKTIGTARTEFLVFDRDIELSNPAADHDQMAALAAWTRHDGGRMVPPEELPQLLEEIKNRPPDFEERQIKWELTGRAGPAWTMFLLLAACLSAEWGLRKKWGLV